MAAGHRPAATELSSGRYAYNDESVYAILNKDVASGISFEKRQEFFKLLDLVINHKVSKVIITHKDRLSRVGFEMFKHLFKHLFKHYHVDIVIVSEIADDKTDQQEIFEEIVSLLHAFSMKMYSTCRKKIKELLGDQDDASNTETIA